MCDRCGRSCELDGKSALCLVCALLEERFPRVDERVPPSIGTR